MLPGSACFPGWFCSAPVQIHHITTAGYNLNGLLQQWYIVIFRRVHPPIQRYHVPWYVLLKRACI